MGYWEYNNLIEYISFNRMKKSGKRFSFPRKLRPVQKSALAKRKAIVEKEKNG